MNKTIFVTALLVIFIFSCDNNDDFKSEDKISTSSMIEIVNYKYKGKDYFLNLDVSDEENSILLEGKDNEVLSNIFEDHKSLTMVYVNESTYSLFDNEEEYEKSSLYMENENAAAAFKKNIEKNKKSAVKKTSTSITSSLPDRGKNTNSEAYLYRRGALRFSGGGFYVNMNEAENNYLVTDFRHLSNSSKIYGGTYGSIFPESAFNSGNNVNHNDAISSLYISRMKVKMYEHQQFNGRRLIFDARNVKYNRIKVDNLKDIRYSCGFLCTRNFNDKISSAIYLK